MPTECHNCELKNDCEIKEKVDSMAKSFLSRTDYVCIIGVVSCTKQTYPPAATENKGVE